MTLLSGTLQPPLLTLLSSTSSPALSPLFTTKADPASPDSSIHIVNDSQANEHSGQSHDGEGEEKRHVPKNIHPGSIVHPVIHIQSPDMRHTYIQAGCSYHSLKSTDRAGERNERQQPLGVKLPWLGLQLKELGRREHSFEVGVVDTKGREGIVRCSSYKTEPSIHPHRHPPLLHLPLTTSSSSNKLTPWHHISLDLSSILPLFQSLPRQGRATDREKGTNKKRRMEVELPSGSFGAVSYVRVYANCRVRRIWFSAQGERTLESMGKDTKEEWALHAAEESPILQPWP